MITLSRVISRKTRSSNEILDLTPEVQEVVRGSGIRTGQITLLVVGSTAALSTLEHEPGLVGHDVAAALERVAPTDAHYEHEATWHDDNGHSHVRSFLVGPSLALPIVEGSLPLGTWQQVVLIELDTRPRNRQVVMTLVGSAS